MKIIIAIPFALMMIWFIAFIFGAKWAIGFIQWFKRIIGDNNK